MKLKSARVVDDLFSEPNCRLSILSIIDFISQSAMNRSHILAKVGVREIGRKSVLISFKFFTAYQTLQLCAHSLLINMADRPKRTLLSLKVKV
jgi:hypothetical protein